ncbi:hypothetical protein Trihar35433_4044 [Trichoderma harzianum]|nr:hypothetical protein Trihar35433_4044 [Trichoderma harzianum]
MTSFQPSHILVLGATGNVGKAIMDAIVNASPAFTRVSILTSKETAASKSDLIDGWKSSGVSIVLGDVTNPQDIETAYDGVDTVISCLGRGALEAQKELIRLAEESPSVRWFFPSEFGTDPEHNERSAQEKPHQTKLAVRKFILENTKQLNVTYLIVGPYFDMWVDQRKWSDGLGGVDVVGREAILTGDGNTKIGFTTLKDAGTAVVAALRHPEESHNAVLRVASFVKTSNEVFSEYEKQLGVKFSAKYISLADHEAEEGSMWEKGSPWAVVAALRRIWATGGAMYDHFSNEDIGLGNGGMESLEEAVRKHVNSSGRSPSITIQADGETPATPASSCTSKRKPEEGEFENNHDAKISKKQVTLHHHEAPSPSLSSFASIRPPEPLSINGILRQHCRKSVYVKPLYWTLQHLELLGCQFHAKIAKEENARHAENAGGFQGQSQGQTGGDQVPWNTTKLPPDIVIRRAVKEFSRYTFPSILSKVMRDILKGYGMTCKKQQVSPLCDLPAIIIVDQCKSQFSSSLNFYFNGRHVNSLCTYGTFLRTTYESDGPSLAFLSLRDVSRRRDMSIRPWHVRRNSPEYRISEKKRNDVGPANEVEDLYIAAVLIALAQNQQRRQHAAAGTQTDTLNRKDASDGESKGYKVFLHAHTAMYKPCLYFYTARVPSSFLDRLDHPSVNIPSRPFRIKYHQISFSSIDAMKEDLRFAISVMHGEEYVF